MARSLYIGIIFTFIILIAFAGWLIFMLAILLEKLALYLVGVDKNGPIVTALHSNLSRYELR